MLCASVSERTAEACGEILDGLREGEMTELRADLMSVRGGGEVDDAAMAELCARKVPKVLTCRDLKVPGFTDERKDLLTSLMDGGGVQMVDLEIEAPQEYREAIIASAKSNGVKVVVSYHNYEETPADAQLQEIIETCKTYGADIAKVAVACKSRQDAARVLALYNTEFPTVALGMGAPGKITRMAALQLGAPFTFVALSPETATAPGQLTLDQMRQIADITA
ncbi:Pentafunctional AROM polypeptide [Hondaea fermentalgiana]|uniref:3-dehydroquinate dehydratase n=1 Tax=Hondaea fermentalgiana TaxID=2315210 RepID=A0A2R5GTR7_9STRA|nr:Pentafunctional AROM polypeptide [Hondaea fermentalgiana]|eukprot:GBG33965.1 Pentafunctional AROM polypeptide [Hondaea fermentalgiana]